MIFVAATVLNALWQDTLLVVCVWLLLRAWPRVNAATRYAVWGATLIAALAVPVATTMAYFTPARTVAAAATHTHAAMTSSGPVTASPSHRSVRATHEPARTSSSETSNALPSLPPRLRVTLPLPVALAVFAAWVLLAAYALIGLLVGLWRLEQLKRDALPLPIDYRDAMPQWTHANKGRRPVRLCVSDAIDVPVAVGLFDAMILIPQALLDRLSPAEVEQISLHELAHLRRGDDWSNCLQRLIVAALGWNPAALFVAQQLELEREVACDDWVLSSVGAVRPYALCLTKMAETAAWPHHPMPAPGVFTTRKQISLRIERLLGTGRDIATSLAIGPTAAAVAAVGALALVIAFVAPSVAEPTVAAPVVAAKKSATEKPAAVAKPVASKPVVVSQASASPARATSVPAAPSKPVVITKTVYVKASPAAVAEPPKAPELNPGTALAGQALTQAGQAEAQAASVAGQSMRAAMGNVKTATSDAAAAANVDSKIRSEISKQINAHANAATIAQTNGKSCVGCDMRGVNWSGRDLSGANYTGVDFTRANLSGANLSGSILNGVDFTRANLSGASFRHAHLTGCDFTESNLNGADFTSAWLSGCEFTGAQLRAAQLRDVLNGCKGCNFTRADLSDADLGGVRINGDDFSHADLRNVNFAGAEIVGSDFSHARLDGANFNGATLNGCDLDGVDLSRVDLSHAKLIGMDFSKRSSPP